MNWARWRTAAAAGRRSWHSGCLIVLLAAEGKDNEWIGHNLGFTRRKVARWRSRSLESGLPGLLRERAGRGRPAKIKPEDKAELIRRTLEETPPMATQWSTRRVAAVAGLAASSVGLIWRNHAVNPHLVWGFITYQGMRPPCLRPSFPL